MAAMLSKLIILILSYLLHLNTVFTFIYLASKDHPFLKYYCIDHNGNYTANSTYQANLNTLLSNLTSDTSIDYGFYNFSLGQDSDKVNAIGLCRGDVKPEPCRRCLNDSRVSLTQLCPNQKEAIGWQNRCMLRYSSRSIFGAMEHKPRFYKNTRNRKEAYNNEQLSEFLGSLRRRAASGDSHLKFADDSLSGLVVFKNIFAHAQCTPDLSKDQCDECLIGAISDVGNFCFGEIQCVIGKPSCYLKFDTHSYFHYSTFDVPPSQAHASPPPPPPPPPSPTPPPQPPPPPPQSIKDTSKEDSQLVLGSVIAIAVPIVSFGVLVLLTSICIYLGRKRLRKYFESDSVAEDEIKPNEILQFDLRTITVATNNFSEANKLGQGGFGLVYKGTLSNGDEVAIKRLSKSSGQGEIEFKNELVLVAKLQHRNLVRLLGFCLETEERLLVYEFLPNKSLDRFIFDPIKRAQLDWESRYKIAKGIARGLLYLHEDSGLRIIHRDLKASNILLDKDMNPKIADFGMARLFPTGQSLGNTHIIVGTYGYMAPEYALHGHISVKSDVFSFGVLLLEIVSGLKNGDIRDEEYVEHLISFAWRNWRDGTITNIIDPTINDSSRNEIMRCIHIGLLCVQENVVDRPTMASVVVMINSYSLNLPIPSQPAYFLHTRGFIK